MTHQLTHRPATMIDPALVAETMAALRTPAGQLDPYPLYARLRAEGVAGAAPDGALVVVGYDACAAILREHRLVKTPARLLSLSGFPDWEQHPALRTMYGSMLMRNAPEHTRLRQAVSAAFTARRVAQLDAAIDALADQVLDRMQPEADFVDTVAFPFPVAVIAELLGIPAADRPMFQHLVRDWTLVLEQLTPEAVAQADEAAATLRDYLGTLAVSRRDEPADDLVSALVTGEALDEADLVTMLALLLGAGFETTTGLFANGLLALLGAPAQLAAARKQSRLTADAANELLRFDTPVQMLFGRSAVEDVECGGVRIAAGQRLITIVGAANRDPDVYDAPDELRLDRGGAAPLSFGGGIHYCLGAPLAKLEAQIMFPKLVRRFPRLRLSGEPVHRPGLTLHSYVSIPVSTR
jgi:cytochrome P450